MDKFVTLKYVKGTCRSFEDKVFKRLFGRRMEITKENWQKLLNSNFNLNWWITEYFTEIDKVVFKTKREYLQFRRDKKIQPALDRLNLIKNHKTLKDMEEAFLSTLSHKYSKLILNLQITPLSYEKYLDCEKEITEVYQSQMSGVLDLQVKLLENVEKDYITVYRSAWEEYELACQWLIFDILTEKD